MAWLNLAVVPSYVPKKFDYEHARVAFLWLPLVFLNLSLVSVVFETLATVFLALMARVPTIQLFICFPCKIKCK